MFVLLYGSVARPLGVDPRMKVVLRQAVRTLHRRIGISTQCKAFLHCLKDKEDFISFLGQLYIMGHFSVLLWRCDALFLQVLVLAWDFKILNSKGPSILIFLTRSWSTQIS